MTGTHENVHVKQEKTLSPQVCALGDKEKCFQQNTKNKHLAVASKENWKTRGLLSKEGAGKEEGGLCVCVCVLCGLQFSGRLPLRKQLLSTENWEERKRKGK